MLGNNYIWLFCVNAQTANGDGGACRLVSDSNIGESSNLRIDLAVRNSSERKALQLDQPIADTEGELEIFIREGGRHRPRV